MIEFYPQVRSLHIALAIASGTLFLLRGVLVQLRRPGFAMAAPVRYLSYGIDTLLLTAALMLLTMLPSAVFANGWLAAKLVLLGVYVALATFALKRGRTARVRLACLVAAILVFGFIVSIARTHQPLGLFA